MEKLIVLLIILFSLYILILFMIGLDFWNLIVVNKKYGNTKGYFRSTALSIDIWANFEFRTLWNTKLRIDGVS